MTEPQTIVDSIDVLDRTMVWTRVSPESVPALAQGSAPATLELSPAIEREVFQLARRVALQADLPAAMRVLRQSAARLLDAPDVMCMILDPALRVVDVMPELTGGATSGVPSPGQSARPPAVVDGDLVQIVARVAQTGSRMVYGHTLVEPVGSAPARAVLVARRPSDSVAYSPFEVATAAAIAAAIVGIVGHFVTEDEARRAQALQDSRLPFRAEALAARRGAVSAPGRLVTTPRTWMRWAYPGLIGLVVGLLAIAALVQVPTYSTGISIITIDGEQVTSPMPGTVAEVLVAPGARVGIGDPLLRLRALDETAELAATEADYRNALATFLTTPRDDGARMALATIATRRQHAKALIEARVLRAATAGIVGDVRARPGQLVTPGTQVMKISPGSTPSVIALLPGFDRPRLQLGMTLQVELPGYHKKRDEAVIDAIGSQVIGPEEARKSLGDPIGDALPITGSVVIVRAHLTSATFEASGREYAFHDGMLGKAEVKVDHDSLLRALLPGKGD
jgi:membrane fusion protein (multidrug efflux system)